MPLEVPGLQRSILLCIVLLMGGAVLPAQSSRPTDAPPPGSVPGQARGITVQGRVVPAQGQASLPSLMTATLNEFSRGVVQTILVRDGLFEFRNVGPGRYTVRLSCDGFHTVEARLDLLERRGNRMEFLQISMGARLKGAGGADVPGENSTVDAGFLAVPDKAQRELEKAQKASRRERYEQAVRHLQKALSIHADFPEAYNNLAVQYLRLGRPEEALEALERSLQLRPTAQAYQNLGILHMEGGRYRDAAVALGQAHERDPSDGQTLRSLGELYFRVGQYQTALAWFDRVQDDADAMLALARGHCYLRLERAEEALAAFQRFLVLEPSGPRARETRRLVSRLRQP